MVHVNASLSWSVSVCVCFVFVACVFGCHCICVSVCACLSDLWFHGCSFATCVFKRSFLILGITSVAVYLCVFSLLGVFFICC